MPKIKLHGKKTIRAIMIRILAGESSIKIAKDYEVSSGHIRKIRARLKDINCPYGRWKQIDLTDELEEQNELNELNKENGVEGNQ